MYGIFGSYKGEKVLIGNKVFGTLKSAKKVVESFDKENQNYVTIEKLEKH